MTNAEISIIPLTEEHFSLIHTWFNKPHVQAFYSLRTWTNEDVREKLTPYIQGVGDMKCYIIFVDKKPMGHFPVFHLYFQAFPFLWYV